MLNKVVLMGRLTADPALKYTGNNLPVVSFTLAVGRNYVRKEDGQRETDFIDIVAWRNTAEFISKYFRKGSLIVVTGMLQTRTWKDQQGNNRKAVEVIADEVYFAEGRRDGARPDYTEENTIAKTAAPAFEGDETDEFFELSGDEDLPF